MARKAKRGLVFLMALIFLAIGLVGFLLPFLPGFVFIAVALILLSMLSPRFRDWADRRTSKYPAFHKIVQKLDAWVRKTVGEV